MPIISLLIAVVVNVAPCVIWARVDAKRGQFRPLARAMTVALCVIAVFVAIIVYQVVEFQSRARAGNTLVYIAWGSLLLSLIVTFIVASVIGSIAYRIGYRMSSAAASVEGSYGGDEPVTRLEETGNPYQPPST